MTMYQSLISNKLEELPSNRTPNILTAEQTLLAFDLIKKTAETKTFEEIDSNFDSLSNLAFEIMKTITDNRLSIYAADYRELQTHIAQKVSPKHTRLLNKHNKSLAKESA